MTIKYAAKFVDLSLSNEWDDDEFAASIYKFTIDENGIVVQIDFVKRRSLPCAGQGELLESGYFSHHIIRDTLDEVLMVIHDIWQKDLDKHYAELQALLTNSIRENLELI